MNHEDILSPATLYPRLREEHIRTLEETFQTLLRRSGIDPAANAALVTVIRRLETQLAALARRERHWRWAHIALWMLVGFGGAAAVLWLTEKMDLTPPLIPGPAALLGALLCAAALTLIHTVVNVRLRRLRAAIAATEAERAARVQEAWAQMEPLNALFRWDTMATLTMRTLPILAIDRYLSEERLGQLVRLFGWSGRLGDQTSATACQSGAINGNPWLLVDFLKQRWEDRTYTGTRTISWTERIPVTVNGRRTTRLVVRTQVLRASIERPVPVYAHRKRLIYGNEAAPTLTFSRSPNGLAAEGGRPLERAIDALDKRNRDVYDPFTFLDDPAFDAAFAATDRNDEVQFRLLFTPLAQQEMFALMRDTENGCGDAFTFVKHGPLNILTNTLLDSLDLSASPTLLRNYALDTVHRQFLDYGQAFFRGLFFTFAPLFCIPIYQQHRHHEDIYTGIIETGPAAPIELQTLVNALDEKHFRPRGADTPSILTTALDAQSGHDIRLNVTADAFHGYKRVEYVKKRGGDGHVHDIPIHWVEYLPVTRTVTLGVCPTGTTDLAAFLRDLPTPEWRTRLNALNLSPKPLLFRRGLAAFPTKRTH